MKKARLLNNRYALHPEPRHGGMSAVFRANDLEQGGKLVAVKLFDASRVKIEILDEVFHRETRALKELKHPNIADLLDDGIDDDSGGRFLVLEWVESDLARFVTQTPFSGWDDFEALVGLPILDALAHAHGRDIAHRDVKPPNVLIDGCGTVKLTDFGISKLKRTITPAITLNEFTSRPFTPPEFDDGSYTFSRDVYGFAMLALTVLAKRPTQSYADIPGALNSVSAPPEVLAMLEKALSADPARRQANAGILLTELRNLRSARERRSPAGASCSVVLTEGAVRTLRRDLCIDSSAEVERYVSADLSGELAMQRYIFDRGKPTQRSEPGCYELLGASLRYRIVVGKNGYQLCIDDARTVDFGLLERWRRECWKPPLAFALGRTFDPSSAKRQLELIERGIQDHESGQRAEAERRRDEEMFSIWANLLEAKREAEKQKQKPLRYTDARVGGNHVEFTLETASDDEELIGQPRRVSLENNGYIAGEVEDVQGDRLTLSCYRRVMTDSIPVPGELVFDTSAAEKAIDRQKAALEAVKLNQAVRSTLRGLLVNPTQAREPEKLPELDFVIKDLDDTKRAVVKMALAAPDFAVVEGPPGTGKTTFIAELVLQCLRSNPAARILITSQTHVALDNAVGKILKAQPGLNVVRIARPDDHRVGTESKDCTIEEQLRRWGESIKANSEAFLAKFADENGIEFGRVRLGVLLQRLANETADIATGREELKKAQAALDAIRRAKRAQVAEISLVDGDAAASEVDLLRERLEVSKKKREAILDEIRDAKLYDGNPDRLDEERIGGLIQSLLPESDAGKKLETLIRVQADWLERFGRGTEFNGALFSRSQVVAGTCIGMVSVRGSEDVEYDLCILDEASKATATEAIVPLSRARKWILVGDSRQLAPFEDELIRRPDLLEEYELEESTVRQTLFDRLLAQLPPGCRRMLTTQHRMVAPIGDLVSRCFYNGQVVSARKDVDSTLTGLMGKAVVWLTTCRVADRHEARERSSYVNNREAVTIRDLLVEISDTVAKAKKKYSVCVLSGYMGQLAALRRLARGEPALAKTPLDITFSTVDAVQGREADIVIYSVTRANQQGKVGFLKEARRINVALSRGRELLIIVGDHEFVTKSREDHPLKHVFTYIDKNPRECDIQLVTP